MRLVVSAIGRLKKGPEQELDARYSDRIKKAGKAIGVTDFQHLESAESRSGSVIERKLDEATMLTSKLPTGTLIIAFDERGKRPDSQQFAKDIKSAIDNGKSTIACLIGGPDGLDENLRNQADMIVSFGSLTMPHQLVRILVVEQLYRAITILTGHPYHRE